MQHAGGSEQLDISAKTKRQLNLEGLLDDEKHAELDRKSTRLNSSHPSRSRMPSSAWKKKNKKKNKPKSQDNIAY